MSGCKVAIVPPLAVAACLLPHFHSSHKRGTVPWLPQVVCLFLVLLWTENYGERGETGNSAFSLACREIYSRPSVALLGAIQALFEGAMYVTRGTQDRCAALCLLLGPANKHGRGRDGSPLHGQPRFSFVFMWVPTVLRVAPSSPAPPLGLLFASFMVCITLGGTVSSSLMVLFGLESATALIWYGRRAPISRAASVFHRRHLRGSQLPLAITACSPVPATRLLAKFLPFLVHSPRRRCWFPSCPRTLPSSSPPSSSWSSAWAAGSRAPAPFAQSMHRIAHQEAPCDGLSKGRTNCRQEERAGVEAGPPSRQKLGQSA